MARACAVDGRAATRRVLASVPGAGHAAPVRRPAVVLLLGALLSALGLWAAAPAQACDCSTGTTAESAGSADAVFTGRLVSTTAGERPPGAHPASSPPAVHLFAVDTVLKGDVLERQEIVAPADPGSCGLGRLGDEPYAVFASRAEHGGRLFTLDPGQYSTHMCSGTAPLTPALQAELLAVPGLAPPSAPVAAPQAEAASSATADDRTGPVLAGVAALVVVGGAALLVVRRRRGPADVS
jgi:hypothetical protein